MACDVLRKNLTRTAVGLILISAFLGNALGASRAERQGFIQCFQKEIRQVSKAGAWAPDSRIVVDASRVQENSISPRLFGGFLEAIKEGTNLSLMDKTLRQTRFEQLPLEDGLGKYWRRYGKLKSEVGIVKVRDPQFRGTPAEDKLPKDWRKHPHDMIDDDNTRFYWEEKDGRRSLEIENRWNAAHRKR